MKTNLQRIQESLKSLVDALDDVSRGNRDRMFEARDTLFEVSEDFVGTAYESYAVVCEIVQKLIGHLLRNGTMSEHATAEIAYDLTKFVSEAVGRPAPRIQPGHVEAPALKLPGHAREQEAQPQAAEAPAERVDMPAPLPSSAAPEAPRTASQRAAACSGHARRYSLPASYNMVNESRLGHVLVKLGKIDFDQLDRALALQKINGNRLGEVLLAMEAIGMRSLNEALEYQKEETLRLAGDIAANGNELADGEEGGLRLFNPKQPPDADFE